MKKILSLLLALFIAGPSFAMDQLMIVGTGNTTTSTSTTQSVTGFSADKAAQATATALGVISTPGVFSNLRVAVSAAPDNGGGAQSYTMRLVVNGSNSTMTCAISEASTSCTDTTNAVTVAAGDTIRVSIAPSGTPTAAVVRLSLKFASNNSTTDSIYSGNDSTNMSASATNYIGPVGSMSISSTENLRQVVAPMSGTVKNLFVVLAAAPASGKSYAFTMRKNGSNQITTCTVADTATTCNDTANRFTVVAGDLISISSAPTGTPTATTATVGWTFQSDTPQLYMLALNSANNTPSASVTSYVFLNGNGGGFDTTATNFQSYVGENFYIKGLYARAASAPANGAGTQSWQFSLRDQTNTVDLAPTCTISEASTTCQYYGQQALTAGVLYNTEIIPSGTPTVNLFDISYIASYTATATTTIKNATINNATIQGF